VNDYSKSECLVGHHFSRAGWKLYKHSSLVAVHFGLVAQVISVIDYPAVSHLRGLCLVVDTCVRTWGI